MSAHHELPIPPETSGDREAVVSWVSRYLGDLASGDPAAAPTRGGQSAADAALDSFDVTGYARRRNSCCPFNDAVPHDCRRISGTDF
jgi:deoxyribodipyrimidine photo-lyase